MYSFGRVPGDVRTTTPDRSPTPTAKTSASTSCPFSPELESLSIEVSAFEERYTNGLYSNLGGLVNVVTENSSKEAVNKSGRSLCLQAPQSDWSLSVVGIGIL